MPRNVRNYWIEADIDGRRNALAGGPVRKDGGFDLTIKMREHGWIKDAVAITGRVDKDGNLVLSIALESATTDAIVNGGRHKYYTIKTER